jgi:hypothetical protein
MVPSVNVQKLFISLHTPKNHVNPSISFAWIFAGNSAVSHGWASSVPLDEVRAGPRDIAVAQFDETSLYSHGRYGTLPKMIGYRSGESTKINPPLLSKDLKCSGSLPRCKIVTATVCLVIRPPSVPSLLAISLEIVEGFGHFGSEGPRSQR